MGCGVLGIIPDKGRIVLLDKVLTLLDNMKNRGDDGTGVLFLKSGKMRLEKWTGNAQDLPRHTFDNLMNSKTARRPDVVLGHARYATKGKINLDNIHPVIASKGKKMVTLVANGEISFTDRWAKEAEENGIDLHGSTNDMAHAAAKILSNYLQKESTSFALKEFYKQAFPFGAFSFIGVIMDGSKKNFFYMREGMKPLHYSKINGWTCFFSETGHLNGLGINEIKSVKPGEIGIIKVKTGKKRKINMHKSLKGISSRGLCPFELTYFQNYDSKVDGTTIDSIRREFGKELAKEHPPMTHSVVSWVPKSGISATQGYFEEALKSRSNIEFRQAITRKPDSRKRGERSFLGYKSLSLEEKLKRKFAINKYEVEGEDIVIIDDSIVRGNVSAWIAGMVKEENPKSIHYLSAWPPMISDCRAGIDLEKEELIALKYFKSEQIIKNQKKLEKEMAKKFKSEKPTKVFDSVSYASIDGVKKVYKRHLKGKICSGCFTGKYSYVHKTNLKNIPEWLSDYMKKNKIELPKEIKL